MPLYLRAISKRRWDRDELAAPWLGADEIHADTLNDMRVDEKGTLSFWHIEDDQSNIGLVIVALVANRTKFDNLDYILFNQEIVSGVNIKAEPSDGMSPVAVANKWHRDLIELTAEKLVNLTRAMFDNFVKKDRLYKDELQKYISQAVDAKQLDLAKVPEKAREQIIKQLAK